MRANATFLKKPIALCIVFTLVFLNNPTQAQSIYVDSAAIGTNSGLNWTDAYNSLQDALTSSISGDTIFVAKGTYFPSTTNRLEYFNVPKNSIFLGGYPNGGGVRSPKTNPTILSGNIGADSTHLDNSYNIIRFTDVGNSTLDGFILEHAYAPNSIEGKNSGAIVIFGDSQNCSPVIKNCTIRNNTSIIGSGIFAYANSSGNIHPKVQNCIFNNNQATERGDAINFEPKGDSSHMDITQCLFYQNTTYPTLGFGAIFAGYWNNSGVNSDINIIQSTFHGNTPSFAGLGFEGFFNVNIKNSIIDDIYTAHGPLAFSHENSTFKQSNDPKVFFVDTANADFHLLSCAYGYNNGDSTYIQNILSLDLDGNPRVKFSNVDMGVYEHQNHDSCGRIWVTGQGISIPFKDNLISLQDSTDFGITNINDSIIVNYKVYNKGDDTLHFWNGAILIGIDSASFSITQNLPLKLNPADSCTLTVMFKNGVPGLNKTQIYIQNSDISKSEFRFNIQGRHKLNMYVDSSALGLNTGETWVDAYTDLQSALNISNYGDTIFVAEGTYYPTDSLDRTIRFVIPSGVKLIGGYSNINRERKWNYHKTILSGNIGDTSIFSDNSTGLINSAFSDSTTLLDGFIISDAQVTGIENAISIYSSNIRLRNNLIQNNQTTVWGGDLVSIWGNSKPVIEKCIFFNNTISTGTDYLTINSSSPYILNNVFHGYDRCRLISSRGLGKDVIVNNTIIGNFNFYWHHSSNYLFENNVVWHNNNTITNLNNPSHNIFSNSIDGDSTNLFLLPISFYDIDDPIGPDGIWLTNDDGLQLTTCSAALNAGNDSLISLLSNTDILDESRILNGAVDLGAYERLSTENFVGGRLYVDQSASGNGSGNNWTNAYTDFNLALRSVGCLYDTILVAEGVYHATNKSNHQSSFRIYENLTIIGGYPSGGGERDWLSHPTILSGEIGDTSTVSDNSIHLISVSNVSNVVITGFQITGGYIAQYSYSNKLQKHAGGIFLLATKDSFDVEISDCYFKNNHGRFGGAIAILTEYNGKINTLINRCTFEENTTFEDGTSVYLQSNDSSKIYLNYYQNLVFNQPTNFIKSTKSGIYTPIVKLYQNTLIDKSNIYQGIFYYLGDYSTDIKNNILWGKFNSSFFIPNNNVILTDDSEGYFIDSDNNDYRLSYPCNPVIDSGQDSILNHVGNKDIAGNPRKQFSHIDIGAFESNHPSDCPIIEVFGNDIRITNNDIIPDTSDNTDFGTVFILDSNIHEFTIINNGFDTLDLSSGIIFIGDDSVSFVVKQHPDSYLPAGDTTLFSVKLLPLKLGPISTTLQINNNSTNAPSFNFTIKGTGFSGGHNIYVDSSLVVSGNGLSWHEALKDLQMGLQHLSRGDTIFVAEGTYYPTNGWARYISFKLVDSTVLLGGFPHGGGIRDWKSNKTVLSGNIGTINASDNSFQVVSAKNLISETTISGFYINGGQAIEASSNPIRQRDGGGIFIDQCDSLILENLILEKNHCKNNGGGCYINSTNYVLIKNVIFAHNTTSCHGGALYAKYTTIDLVQSLFTSNIANDTSTLTIFEKGGAINNFNSTLNIYNSTFTSNKAKGFGGAVSNDAQYPYTAQLHMENCVFWDNYIDNEYSFEENDLDHSSNMPTALNSFFQIYTGGINCFHGINPDFSQINNARGNDNKWCTSDDGLIPNPCSPLVNAGIGNLSTYNITKDIMDSMRITGSAIDIGAYEYSGSLPTYRGNLFVDSTATGNGHGTSWTNAFTSLEDAINVTCNYDTVFIAEGTYYPTNTNNRSVSFEPKDSTIILGGYPSGGGTRDWKTYLTILSGDIGTKNYEPDNSYSVVQIINQKNDLLLDGLVIQSGVATSFNSAGALTLSSSNPTLRNIIFRNNHSTSANGAVTIYYSNPLIENCVFENNSGLLSGAFLSSGTGGRIRNCIFYQNNSNHGGGAIYSAGDSLFVTNCTFFDNHSNNCASDIKHDYSQFDLFISNCVMDYLDTDCADPSLTLNHSFIVNDSEELASMFNPLNPFYINKNNPIGPDNIWLTSDDGLQLDICSPLIDAGNNLVDFGNLDILDSVRLRGLNVDIGAYESNFPNRHFARIYVDSSATGLNNGESWIDALNQLDFAVNCLKVDSIFVAKGTYFPSDSTRGVSNSLRPKSGTTILGGYQSGGTQRNLNLYKSIISGEVGNPNNPMDNLIHSLILDRDQIVIDGMHITNGYANHSSQFGFDGGGVLLLGEATVRNTIIYNNHANRDGAGIYVGNEGELKLINSKIINNTHGNGNTGSVFKTVIGGEVEIDPDSTID